MPSNSSVCAECMADAALVTFVETHANATCCDFCEREGEAEIAADTDAVLEHVSRSLFREWSTPLEAGLAWDNEIGKWIGGPIEALRFSWDIFRQTVMHETRFLFALRDYDSSYDDPGQPVRRGAKMLDELGRLIADHNLISELQPQDTLYRVRVSDLGRTHSTAAELGTPEASDSKQSRMSPAGIPMFYAAADVDTALAETIDPEHTEGKAANLGRFRVREAISVVDLTRSAAGPEHLHRFTFESARRVPGATSSCSSTTITISNRVRIPRASRGPA